MTEVGLSSCTGDNDWEAEGVGDGETVPPGGTAVRTGEGLGLARSLAVYL